MKFQFFKISAQQQPVKYELHFPFFSAISETGCNRYGVFLIFLAKAERKFTINIVRNDVEFSNRNSWIQYG